MDHNVLLGKSLSSIPFQSISHNPLDIRRAPENLRKTKLCTLYFDGLCHDVDCNYAHSKSLLSNCRPQSTHDNIFEYEQEALQSLEVNDIVLMVGNLMTRRTDFKRFL